MSPNTWSLLNFFLPSVLLTSFCILLYFVNNLSSLNKKSMVLASSEIFTYLLIFGSKTQKSLTSFSFFLGASKIHRTFFLQGNSLDTNTLLRFISSIGISLLEEWNLCFLITRSWKFRNSLSILYSDQEKNYFLEKIVSALEWYISPY